MSTFDLDPNGFLPLLRALASHFRRIAHSRAWCRTSRPAGCA